MYKGSRVDGARLLPREVADRLVKKAADLCEIRGVTSEVEAERITSDLFLGAGIAMEGGCGHLSGAAPPVSWDRGYGV